jgi:hypothetical protein
LAVHISISDIIIEISDDNDISISDISIIISAISSLNNMSDNSSIVCVCVVGVDAITLNLRLKHGELTLAGRDTGLQRTITIGICSPNTLHRFSSESSIT